MRPNERYLRRVIQAKADEFRVSLPEWRVSELVDEYRNSNWPSGEAVENDVADAVRELGEPKR